MIALCKHDLVGSPWSSNVSCVSLSQRSVLEYLMPSAMTHLLWNWRWGGRRSYRLWMLKKKVETCLHPMLHALGADVQVIFWFHLPPQMTIILGHSLQVKALGPKKECPYDVHRRFVSCNLARCTLRLYPGKNLQKGCSNPGSSTKDPLNRKPIRQIGCLAPSVLVTIETRDMFPSDAYWEVFLKWRNPCPNHPCLMLNQKGHQPLQLTPNIVAFGHGFARSPRNLPPDPVQQLPLGSLDGTQEITKSKWELNPTLHEVLYLG